VAGRDKRGWRAQQSKTDNRIYSYWYDTATATAAKGSVAWPDDPLFQYYLWRRQIDPVWPARVYATLSGGLAIPPWLMEYDAHVESLQASCLKKLALIKSSLSA
jgi:hypothetical protein